MWRATSDTAKAARDSADALRATERAYVHAGAAFGGVKTEGSAYVIQTNFAIAKYGKTPAVINGIKILWNLEPKIPDGQEMDVFPRQHTATILDKDPITDGVGVPVKGEDWKDILALKKQLFFLVRVEYQDVFDESYIKDFWWVFKPTDRVWSIYKNT